MADLPVSQVSATEVLNRQGWVTIQWPKFSTDSSKPCVYDKADFDEAYGFQHATKISTPNNKVIEKTGVLGSDDKVSVSSSNDREVQFTTWKVTGSPAYKNVISPIINEGRTQHLDDVQLTAIAEYEYVCKNDPTTGETIKEATGVMHGVTYVGPLNYDNSWYSGEPDKQVEHNFTIPTYTHMEYITISGDKYKAFAQAMIDGKYPYGNPDIYNPYATGDKFVSANQP